MTTALATLHAWATSAGIRVVAGDAHPSGDFRSDPRVDFARVITRTPGYVLHPTTVDQLAACMRQLGALEIPFTTRGAAHSAGGQVLIEGNAVIDLRNLSRVVADDPAAQTVTVEGGAWWLMVAEHLAASGRRPVVMTGNARTTIGGTLAVGGFGDSTHRAGLQVEHVAAMTVITVDGERHVVRPGDPLFDYTLCGRGQLAVIAEATLGTVTRGWSMRGRMLGWYTLKRFLEGARRIMELGAFDMFRARLQWKPGQPVIAVSGDLAGDVTSIDQISVDDATPLETANMMAVAREDPHAVWWGAAPALEIVLPFPTGVATWARLADMIVLGNVHQYMPLGTAIMLVRSTSQLPLRPLPPGDLAMMIALRPECPVAEGPRVQAVLEQVGRAAMDAGARTYLMSIELGGPQFLERQFGDALPAFRALKDRYDPRRLLNPWIL